MANRKHLSFAYALHIWTGLDVKEIIIHVVGPTIETFKSNNKKHFASKMCPNERHKKRNKSKQIEKFFLLSPPHRLLPSLSLSLSCLLSFSFSPSFWILLHTKCIRKKFTRANTPEKNVHEFWFVREKVKLPPNKHKYCGKIEKHFNIYLYISLTLRLCCLFELYTNVISKCSYTFSANFYAFHSTERQLCM